VPDAVVAGAVLTPPPPRPPARPDPDGATPASTGGAAITAASPELANTGSNTVVLLTLSVVFVVTGASLIRVSQRTSRRSRRGLSNPASAWA
jgi:hypothetical protein